MNACLPAFQEYLTARYTSSRTIATYAAHVTAFFERFGEQARAREPFSGRGIDAFLGDPRAAGPRRAATSRNQRLSALRAFAQFARTHLGWEIDPTEGLPYLREPPHDPVVLTI